MLETVKTQEPNLLYFVLTGSRAYGIHSDGSDYDYRGVFINTLEEVLGLSVRNSQEYTGDIILHSLRAFAHLALSANPNILELLFLSKEYHLFCHDVFKEFIDNKDIFLSQKVKYSYSGYAYSQLQRSAHKSTHGTIREKYKSGELEDSYDSKFAAHTIRLLINGKELITNCTLTPTLQGKEKELIKQIREGKYFKNATEFYRFATDLINELDSLFVNTLLPKTPDLHKVNKLLIKIHKEYYD